MRVERTRIDIRAQCVRIHIIFIVKWAKILALVEANTSTNIASIETVVLVRKHDISTAVFAHISTIAARAQSITVGVVCCIEWARVRREAKGVTIFVIVRVGRAGVRVAANIVGIEVVIGVIRTRICMSAQIVAVYITALVLGTR